MDARDSGFTAVNYDLIYGLPLQTPERLYHTISQSVSLHPDRLAFYNVSPLSERRNVRIGFIYKHTPLISKNAFIQGTPTYFEEYCEKMGEWFDVITYHCDQTDGDVKDLKIIHTTKGAVLLAAINEQPMRAFWITISHF